MVEAESDRLPNIDCLLRNLGNMVGLEEEKMVGHWFGHLVVVNRVGLGVESREAHLCQGSEPFV